MTFVFYFPWGEEILVLAQMRLDIRSCPLNLPPPWKIPPSPGEKYPPENTPHRKHPLPVSDQRKKTPPPLWKNKSFKIWEFYMTFVFYFPCGEEILVLVYYTPLNKVTIMSLVFVLSHAKLKETN